MKWPYDHNTPSFFLHGGSMKKESKFQKDLINEIKDRFPGCIVMKNDAGYIKGIPDLTVLYGEHWAMLECKKDATSEHQTLQDYYIRKTNDMSYAAFIHAQNKGEILDEMERSFKTGQGR